MTEVQFPPYPHGPMAGLPEAGAYDSDSHDNDGVPPSPLNPAALRREQVLRDVRARQALRQDSRSVAVGTAHDRFVTSGKGRGREGVYDSEYAGMQLALQENAIEAASKPRQHPVVAALVRVFRGRLR